MDVQEEQLDLESIDGGERCCGCRLGGRCGNIATKIHWKGRGGKPGGQGPLLTGPGADKKDGTERASASRSL